MAKQPDEQDPKSRLKGDPHQYPFWTKLLWLFNIGKLPMALPDPDAIDDGTLPEGATAWDWFNKQFEFECPREKRYEIYREMDYYGLVTSLLDAYAEEATQPDYDKGRAIWIESKAKHMIQRGDECLRNVQAEERCTPITRRMCKYGDEFQRLIYQSGQGVLMSRNTKAVGVVRKEDRYARLVGFTEKGQKYRGEMKRDISWPWDYVHFRLLGADDEAVYGTSLLRNLFRPWRQLLLSEDSMLMYRLLRAPDRNLVMIDVGDMEEHEAADYVNRFKKAMRKHEFIDPASPMYRQQYNPLTPLEDIFVPLRGSDSNTRFETLSGSGNVGEIYDVEHYVNSFFGAAGAPKAYFGFEGDIDAKATLQQQDVRFARRCKRIQRACIHGHRQICDIHFTLLRDGPGSNEKFDVSKVENAYLVQMSPISYLDEWERLELIQLRYQIVESLSRLAQDMGFDPRVWATYVLLNFAKLPEDMVLRLISKMPTGDEKGGAMEAVMRQREMEKRLDRPLTEEERKGIFDQEGEARKGFTQLSESEKEALGRAIHNNPLLRKTIANFAEMGEEEMADRAVQQIDPSLLPPVVDGKAFEDTYDHDQQAKQLQEDLKTLRDKTDDQKG